MRGRRRRSGAREACAQLLLLMQLRLVVGSGPFSSFFIQAVLSVSQRESFRLPYLCLTCLALSFPFDLEID